MVEIIIAIIMAIISYFVSKKAGASDAQAAAVGLAAGAGSYYVTTRTDWGKGAVTQLKDWIGLEHGGKPLLNSDGSPAKAPKGAEPVLDGDGVPVRDGQGNVIWKVVDSTGKVLTSWGAAGTAGVVAAGGLVGSVKEQPWLWIGGAVLLALIVMK